MSLEAQALQIKAALDALIPEHAKVCDFYAGEITAQGVHEELAGPRAIFLAYEGEDIDEANTTVTMSGGGADVTQVVWRVYCVVSEQRSTKAALLTTGLPGLLALTSAVKGAINRMRFTGAAAEDVLSALHMQLLNERPVLFQRGVAIAYALRFGYLRALEQASIDRLAGTQPLTKVDGAIDLEPDGAHNPLVRTRNTFP